MTDDGVYARVGLFVGIVVLAVAVGTLGAPNPGSSAPAVAELDVGSYNTDDAVATTPEESGDLSMSADASGKVVVIDTAHGASIDREALTPLVNTLTENGATVKFHVDERQGGRSLNESLREADAFVVFGAAEPYTEEQLAGLSAFTDAGGRLLLMNEPSQASLSISILLGARPGVSSVTSPMVPLTSQYGLSYGNGYLYNVHQYDTNYRSVYATPDGDSPLTDGVDRAVFYAAIPVSGGDPVVTASERTTLSQTRRQGSYDVVARSGNVVAVGDVDVVSQEFLYRGDNEVLVGNLLDFLVSGEKSPSNAPEPSEPTGPGQPPPGRPTPGGALSG